MKKWPILVLMLGSMLKTQAVEPMRDSIAIQAEPLENVILPQGYEAQAKEALAFFPEVKGLHIEFRVTETITPLASRPTIWSIFKSPKNRHYMITISSKSIPILEPIILKNLPYDAQVGVLSHELSHVSDYNHMGFFQFIRLGFGMLSTSYMDHFENNTDRICIDHGAGRKLLAWSVATRKAFSTVDIKKMFGEDALERERYMNPSTIEKIMATHPLYQNK